MDNRKISFRLCLNLQKNNMKKIFALSLIAISLVLSAQNVSYDTIVNNNITKKDNFINSVNWSSIKNKELNQKDIVSKDQDLGFVNTDILAKIHEEATVEYYYTNTIKIDSKDKKYKISIINPVIRVRMGNADLSSLSIDILKKYRNYISTLLDLMKDNFNSKMEWSYDDMVKISKIQNLPIGQKEILKTMIDNAVNLDKKLISDCIKTMKNDNNW